MALVVEAPNEVYSIENHQNASVFLAGGISNCEDWQSYIISELKDVEHITLYNPRRKNFPIDDPKVAEAQISWEFNHLRDADMIIFWFAKGSLNPLVLYELGMWANSTDKAIMIGIDPNYIRKQDVIIQTKLARPELPIFESMEDLINALLEIFEHQQ